MTAVETLLSAPLGYKTGGFEWDVKVPKPTKHIGEKWFQKVLLTDGKHEILGEFQLRNNVAIRRQSTIHIVVCERVELDVNNRPTPGIRVDEWYDASPQMSEPIQEWVRDFDNKDSDIPGKCRTLFIMAYLEGKTHIPEPTQQDVDRLSRWVDIAINGQLKGTQNA